MGRKKIETLIKEKISPYSLNEKGKSTIASLANMYSYELLCECIDIAASSYLNYDKEGRLTEESAEDFIKKIGGIAYNKSLSPIDQQINYLLNIGKHQFSYWDKQKANALLREYIYQLQVYGWTSYMITNDLKNDSLRLIKESRNWSDWTAKIENWIQDIKSWIEEKNSDEVRQSGTILPNELIKDLPGNIRKLCEQINASYECNLFDCTAVIMRRLLESLLVISYQTLNIENEIMNKNGVFHIPLDKIIINAQENPTLKLSSNTKKDMMLFKDLGNYSAHKIWYNCTKGDIEQNALKYRTIIEELLYKSGIKQ